MTARFLAAASMIALLLAGCSPGAQGGAPAEKSTGSASGGSGAAAPAPAAQAPAAPDGARRAALEAQMQKFLGAVRSGDTAAFAAQFSAAQPWRYVLNSDIARPDTVHSSHDTVVVTPERLHRDLATKGDFYSYFLDPGNRGVGSIGMVAEHGERWTLVEGTRFVPEGSKAPYVTSVKWREENGRWVVDEISEWYH